MFLMNPEVLFQPEAADVIMKLLSRLGKSGGKLTPSLGETPCNFPKDCIIMN